MRLLPAWLIVFLFAGGALALARVSAESCRTAAASRAEESEKQSAPAAPTYVGFDRNEYPGDEALPVLRKSFAFASYWLGPPPGEKSSSWEGKRALLESQGFGFLLLFNARESRKIKSPNDAYEKARIDAAQAMELATHEGFNLGTTIYLDVEEGGRLPTAYHDYIRAWAASINASRFHAGVYCSAIPVNDAPGVTITTAEDIQAHLDTQPVVFWVYNDACPPSPGCVFPQNPPPPSSSGSPQAQVWQYAQSPGRKEFASQCFKTYAADGNCYAPGDTRHKWFLDANVSNTPDPSNGRAK
ncbi:MAG TPA: glycoside hydrolase domain-containing protein [Candidatus Eisenbacteria bacterium]|nr:glycoside hydrolase domain-containing protein [Candidatus Eisenbacteria bacterium]